MKILTILLLLLSLTGSAFAIFADGWETDNELRIRRLKTPHGWIVQKELSICYVPDENHEWRLDQ